MTARRPLLLAASSVLIACAAALFGAEDQPRESASRTAPTIYVIGVSGTT
jgi:hypothetical protein